MFSHLFQTGEMGIEILTASGKTPGKDWKMQGGVHRVYDRTIKGFTFLMEKGMNTFIECPSKSTDTLGLIQQYIVFQLRCNVSKPISIEIIVLDNKNNRRRLHFSSKFHDVSPNELHAQLPLKLVHPDKWNNIIIDLKYLISYLYPNYKYNSIDALSITPVCRLRKIFTLPFINKHAILIHQTFQFPNSTEYKNQVNYIC
jgi:hypothetical protein